MSNIAVVDVTTQYLMTFGPLLGDIKKESYTSNFRSTVKLNLTQKSWESSLNSQN